MNRNPPAEERATIGFRYAAHPHEIRRVLVPDRQYEAHLKIEALALVASPRFLDLGCPSISEGVDGNILPAALGQLILGNVTALERAQQFEAGQARTVIGENTAGGHEQSDPTRAGVPTRPSPLPSQDVKLLEPLQCERL